MTSATASAADSARRSLVLALALTGAAAVLWPSVFPEGKLWNYTAWTWQAYTLLGNVAALGGVVLAVLLVWRSRHPAAPHLGASLALAAVAFGAGTNPDLPWPVPDAALRALGAGVTVLAMAGFVRFAALFPRPYVADVAHDEVLFTDQARTPLDRLVPSLVAPLARLVPARVRTGARKGWASYRAWVDRSSNPRVNDRANAIRRSVLRGAAVWAWPLGAAGAVAVGGAAAVSPELVLLASYIVLLPAFLAAYLLLRIAYATGSTDERREVLWIVQGFTAFLIAPALLAWALILSGIMENQMSVTLAALLPAALALGGCAMVASLAVAVFGAGAMDPGAALRRTVAYGALGIITTLVFEAMENLASGYVVAVVGMSGDRAVWISSGAAAMVFGVVHQRLTAGLAAPPPEVGPGAQSRSPQAADRLAAAEVVDEGIGGRPS